MEPGLAKQASSQDLRGLEHCRNHSSGNAHDEECEEVTPSRDMRLPDLLRGIEREATERGSEHHGQAVPSMRLPPHSEIHVEANGDAVPECEG